MGLEPPRKKRFLSEPIDCFESNIHEWELLTTREQNWVKNTILSNRIKNTPSLEKELINVQLRRRGQFINNPEEEQILQSDLTFIGDRDHIKVRLTAEVQPNKAKEIIREAKRVRQGRDEYFHKLEANRIYNRDGWPDCITDRIWIGKRYRPLAPTRRKIPPPKKHKLTIGDHIVLNKEAGRIYDRDGWPSCTRRPSTTTERTKNWRKAHARDYPLLRIANRIYKRDGVPDCLRSQ
jgi:hypothetical protein